VADPKRLMDRVGPGFERAALLLAADERPDPATRERALRTVLAAAAVGAATGAAAAGAGGKASTGLAALFAKWMGAGLLIGGAATFAGSALVEPAPSPPRAESAPQVGAAHPPGAERGAAPSAPTQTREVTIEGSPLPPAASRSQGDVRIGATSTLIEAESMRRIRAEARLDRGRALRLLDEHLLRFPGGESASEARALRDSLARRK